MRDQPADFPGTTIQWQLKLAARAGDNEKIKSLLAIDGDMGDHNTEGMWMYTTTPLQDALYARNCDTAELLLQAGADLGSERLWNPHAVDDTSDGVRRWIIDHGGRPANLKDFISRYQKHYKIIADSMIYFAKLMEDENNNSPFHPGDLIAHHIN